MTTTKRNNRKSTAALTSKPTRSTKTAKHADDSCTSGGSGTPFKRSRSGCYTCRVRRKKCDEAQGHAHGKCTACSALSIPCHWKEPTWWKTVESRKLIKDHFKELIKQTRTQRKPKKTTTHIDSTYGRLLVSNYDHTYDSYNSIDGSERFITPDSNLRLNLDVGSNNSQNFDFNNKNSNGFYLVNNSQNLDLDNSQNLDFDNSQNFDFNNSQNFNLINTNNIVNNNNHLFPYASNSEGVDTTFMPTLTPDATPGYESYESYETPEDLTYDTFDEYSFDNSTPDQALYPCNNQGGWVDYTPPQPISYRMPYANIPNVNEPGRILNMEEQTEFTTMPALDTEQVVDPVDYQITTFDVLQYGDVPNAWAWGTGMEMEGNPHIFQ